MSYSTDDKSPSGGAPIECFYITGEAGTFCLTTADFPVTVDGIEFEPAQVTRSAIEATSVIDSIVTVDIEVPASSKLAKAYCYQTTPAALAITIYRVHDTPGADWNTDFSVEWVGYGLESVAGKASASIRTGSSIQAFLKGSLGLVVYQRSCNHALFDERCKVLKSAWTLASTITLIQEQKITVANDGTTDHQLSLGEVHNTRSGERRPIFDNVGNVLTIPFPFIDVLPGDPVEMIFGCDHRRLGHCKNRFNNVPNYGGFDFIPVTNPFADLHPEAKVVETVKTKTNSTFGGSSNPMFWAQSGG